MGSKTKFSWIIPLVAIVSVCGLFVWQLGIFNMGSSSVTYSGFAKIKPQLAGSGVEGDGRVSMIFTNGAGTRIHVNGIRITNLAGDALCTGVPSQTDVDAGYNFQVTADGCGQGYVGNVYQLRINIEYDVTIAGTTTTHTETGVVRGPYESSGTYAESAGYYERSTTYYGHSYGKPYHRSFDFGDWWIVVVLLSIVYILEANNQISLASAKPTIQALGVYGFVFILCSTLILIFGVDHIFNGQDVQTYSLRLRYGWMIECVVYLGIGLLLAGLSEYMTRKADRSRTVAAAVFRPAVSILALSLSFVYPYRVITSMTSLTMQSRISDFGWIVEILVLMALIVAYYLTCRALAKGTSFNPIPDLFYYAGMAASVYFIIAVGLFIWGVNSLIYTTVLDPRGVVAAFAMAIGGAVLLRVGILSGERPKTATNAPSARKDQPLPGSRQA